MGHDPSSARGERRTFYGTLKRLLDSGLVQETEARGNAETDDERRRYYRITTRGMTTARAEARRLEAMIRVARVKKIIGLKPA